MADIRIMIKTISDTIGIVGNIEMLWEYINSELVDFLSSIADDDINNGINNINNAKNAKSLETQRAYIGIAISQFESGASKYAIGYKRADDRMILFNKRKKIEDLAYKRIKVILSLFSYHSWLIRNEIEHNKTPFLKLKKDLKEAIGVYKNCFRFDYETIPRFKNEMEEVEKLEEEARKLFKILGIHSDGKEYFSSGIGVREKISFKFPEGGNGDYRAMMGKKL